MQKEVERLQEELANSRRFHDMANAKLQKADEDVNLVKNDVKQLDGKIASLKRIREIKLHSDTVKKIYHYGYKPGEMSNYKGRRL